MDKKALEFLSKMEELFPQYSSELENWQTPFQFLVCIVLSAQTTDKQVNKISKQLFERFPDPSSMGSADVVEVETLIKSVNYFRSKAKYLISLSKRLEDVYGGRVPKSVEELVTLSGVGRKTANVFLNSLYEKNEGIGVDTHVMRVAKRLGLSNGKTPEEIGGDLEVIYPQGVYHKVTALFVLYGRYVCKARMTKSDCVFKQYCSYCKDLPAL